MLEHISNFSDYILKGLDSSREYHFQEKEGIQNIVVGGLGGSAIAGDILYDWFYDRIEQPIEVCRRNRLPSYADSKTLFIGISYSGSTIETIDLVTQAKAKRCETYVITSGGKLMELARRDEMPLLSLPAGLPPRVALPRILTEVAYVMDALGLTSHAIDELKAGAEEVGRLNQTIGGDVEVGKNPAKQLAARLVGKYLFVYSPARLASVARRLKSQLNENGKTSSKFELFPELCHNELEGWFSPTTLHNLSAVVILRDNEEDEAEQRTFSEAKRILQEGGMNDIHEIHVEASSKIGRILSSILFCDYLSFYLAVLRGLDPTPVPNIEKFRRRAYSS